MEYKLLLTNLLVVMYVFNIVNANNGLALASTAEDESVEIIS